ncbi:MAG: ABC-type Zn2+ transport system substrate-binding protein/surface adhesin, partial [Hyphomicrobiaceae bacterium]
ALVGDSLASRYDAFKLAALAEKGALAGFLEQQGDQAALGGWLGAMLPLYGAPVIDDHAVWSYFAARFGLKIVGHLEPKPGVPPTTMHLKSVIDTMNSKHVRAVLASPYYDPRHAEFVGKATGAAVAHLAHQTGGIEGTDDYIAMIDYNVRATVAALTVAALTGEK